MEAAEILAQSLTAQELENVAARILAELDGVGGGSASREWDDAGTAYGAAGENSLSDAVLRRLGAALSLPDAWARTEAASEIRTTERRLSGTDGGAAVYPRQPAVYGGTGRGRGAADVSAPVAVSAGGIGETERARSLSEYYMRDSRRYDPGFERY